MAESDANGVPIELDKGAVHIDSAKKTINNEERDRQHCIQFFTEVPGLIVKERWLHRPNSGDGYKSVMNVRDRVYPYKGTPDESSLGKLGLRQTDLTPPMKKELTSVLNCAKSGILKAIVAEGRLTWVPDLRGENFMFDSNGHLRFVETSSLEDCGLREGVTMNDGLMSTIVKLGMIEIRTLARTGDELWKDSFYQAATWRFRVRIGNTKTREYFKEVFGMSLNSDLHKGERISVTNLDEIFSVLQPQEDDDGTRRTLMENFAILDKSADNPTLSTAALVTCVGVAGYDARHGVGFMAHLSSYTDIHLVRRTIAGELQKRYPGTSLALRTTLVYSSLCDTNLVEGWRKEDQEPNLGNISFVPDREIQFEFDLEKLLVERRPGPSDGFALNIRDGTISVYRPQYIGLESTDNIPLPQIAVK